MTGYYSEKLSAERLKRCYEIAPARVRQYLIAEAEYVRSKVQEGDRLLELGCGYGRLLPGLSKPAQLVVGIDNSLASLMYGFESLALPTNCMLACANAQRLPFADNIYDIVVCVQNGISAFHIEPRGLISESLRACKPGGMALFSTYSDKLWNDRLRWFEMQAAEGLLGEIDYDKTGNGKIVCKDGFTATTITAGQFQGLTVGLDADVQLIEVDESSLFCEITKRCG
jgi:2-polyprenyl-6-hydroxyphenyl methylase/3-demethylubiquinone-9 3-methyltransferase